jgi:myo-inositol-1(or 4)-monophosphatase
LTASPTELLSVARQAAACGGEILMKYYRDGVSMRDKTSAGGATFDLVSDADLESEQAIARRIRDAFPGHELLGEETLGKSIDAAACEHLWIIDPLDGTNNYAHRLPFFAISIAYYHRGKPIAGMVHNPASDDWYWASAGGGAWHNDRPAHVCQATSLDQAMIGCGFYYDRGEMMRQTLKTIEELFYRNIHGIRRFGAAAIDLCMLGCGQLSGFFEYQQSPWDFAAGRLFIEEAGGKVSNTNGEQLGVHPSSVLASNGHLHEAMLAITRRYGPEQVKPQSPQ